MLKDFGRLLLRRPVFTYNTLFEATGNTRSLNKLLAEKLSDDIFLEGLYWASPDLFEQVLRLQSDEIPFKKKERIFHSLKKYLIRSSSRCTPYGTYAGCNVVNLGTATPAISTPKKRHVRLDMQILFRLLRSIADNEDFRSTLKYRINNSIYLAGNAYRYLETIVENGTLNYQITSFQQSDIIDQLLANFKNQLFSQDDLVHFLSDEFTLAEKKAYIDELILADFFVSDTMSLLTSNDPISELVYFFKDKDVSPYSKWLPYKVLLEQLNTTMEKLAHHPLGQMPTDDIEACLTLLQKMNLAEDNKSLFHVDLSHYEPTNQISPAIVKDIEQAIYVLAKLTPPDSSHERRIKKFKQLFVEKYGDQTIPLMEAIDVELGIGFPAQANLGSTAFNEMADSFSKSLGKDFAIHEKSMNGIEIWLQEQLRYALENGDTEIKLDVTALEKFESQLPKLPHQISVMGLFLPSNQLLLQSVGGANGFSLLGRFCYMDDEITSLCKDISALSSEDTDALHAEILFSPEGRTANIARRSDILPYKIPYLTYLSDQHEQSIAVEDLYVSVKRDRLCLFSKTLNKEIRPYLTHAHNYMLSEVPLYRFLAALQHQQKVNLYLHWGDWSSWLRFIPRITVGNVVLQKATWQIKADEINQIKTSTDPLRMLRDTLITWKLPRFICLVEGDNELFIDTENDEYLTLLLDELKPKSTAKLAEWLLDKPEKAAAATYVQQFIIPLSRHTKTTIHKTDPKPQQQTLKSVFFPGGEWMYIKIYCGAFIADELLLQIVNPLIKSLLENQDIDQAFFIRYNDPHFHIRLRLHFSAETSHTSQGEILTKLDLMLAPYLTSRIVWKVQLDTYQREIDRYSENAMLDSEQVFFQDSIAILEALQEENILEDDLLRFYRCLQNLDNWLLLFGLSLEDRQNFCSKMAQAFSYEFDKDINRQIDNRFRTENQNWKAILSGTAETSAILTKRKKLLAPYNLPLENLSSYIHMSINRWFSSNHRLLEFTLYKYSEKIYKQLRYHHDKK